MDILLGGLVAIAIVALCIGFGLSVRAVVGSAAAIADLIGPHEVVQ